MSAPHDVLAQLLSPAQADTLDRVGSSVWTAGSNALRGLFTVAPELSGTDGRLVMPDEIVGEFAEPHLVVPFEISTDKDQTAIAHLVMGTAVAARALDSEADDPGDQEQQTMVVAATIVGQVVQALNSQVFRLSASGLVLSMDDLAANTMPALLATMDEPALVLTGRLALANEVPVTLILPGTFLDIVAGAFPAQALAALNAPVSNLPFALTQDDLESAELLEVEEEASEALFAAVGVGAGGAPAPQPIHREPTPIASAPAAQRARFAPIPDPPPPASRSGIDLLAGLQMNVTVELGRTELKVSEVLGLGPGSVIELDRLAGEPVDILVNDRLIARGEVVVVDENFGVRVVEVVRRGSEDERVS